LLILKNVVAVKSPSCEGTDPLSVFEFKIKTSILVNNPS
jgi:hypothetical protein